MRALRRLALPSALLVACSPSSGSELAPDAQFPEAVDAGAETDARSASDGGPTDQRFTVVTFNTGTTSGLAHDSDGDDYGDAQVEISDQHYGDGLAWKPAVAATASWFASVEPDIVVFQELFYSGDCESISDDFHAGFVCEDWTPGDPTVAELILGSGYEIGCHPGKSDKCIAVKKTFGSIRQCEGSSFCLEGTDGAPIANCGGGARVARATIDLTGGGELTVVNVHGTSGSSGSDAECRARQVDQVFVDMDGEPGANGTRNVVLGDFNTDPGRIPGFLDASAARWNQFVGGNQPFQWVSPYGSSAPQTYSGALTIDFVASDAFTGTCYSPGIDGVPAVYENVLFDHLPLVCEIGDLGSR